MSSPEEVAAIQGSKILMVGAGGIGCELLKTLVSSGFKDIHVIDMDTIEVSNLNRQFLFRKFHVGQSKAKVARESVLKFRPDVNIVAHHANIKDKEFDIEFYQKFNVVLNGLDNLDARRHVNRLCLAANVPLVESGTAGYLGQVTVHIKGRTECYECQEKPPPKTYPICTITSTPSKPVHCIVWAKELAFTKLFGDKTQAADLQLGMVEAPLKEEDSTAQPRLQNGEAAIDLACRIFDQIFGQNIEVALKNEDAWKTRRKPSPLYIQEILPGGSGKLDGHDFTHSSVSAMTILGLHDPQKVWNIEDSARVFLTSVRLFFEARSKEIGSLAFDKDDKLALEFVTAAANLRAYSFGIPMLSLFDVKGIAGNIVHAIATTNAIIAGLIVLEAVKILTNNLADSRSTYFLEHPSKNMLLMPVEPFEPNSRCYVCSQTPLVLEVNTLKTKFRDLIEKIVKRKLGVNSPIVMHESNVLYETGEDVEAIMASNYENNLEKILAELSTPVINGTVLRIEDFDQDFTCTVHIKHRDDFDEEKEPDGMLIHDAAIASMPSTTQPNAGNEAKVDGDGDDLEVVSMDEVTTRDRKRKLEEASCSDEKKLKLQLSPKEVL